MPIAPEVTKIKTDYEPTPTIPIPYQSATVDTRQMHPDNLLTFMDGPPIKGDYYKLVIDKDNELAGNMVTRDAVLQQYIKIENMEGKLQNDAAYTQNAETRLFDGNISVMLYASSVVPNVGDLFVVDSMVDVPVIFQVNEPAERKSIYNKTCYLIELSALDFANGLRISDLNNKVVETRVFVKEFLQYGNAPVINKGEFENLLDLAHLRKRVVLDYFTRFYSRRLKTFIVPTDGNNVYDPYMVDFLLKTIEPNDLIEIENVNQYYTGYADEFKSKSILDVLIDPMLISVNSIFTNAGRINKKFLANTISISSIRMSAIDEVVVPTDNPFNIDEDIAMRATNLVADIPLSLIGNRTPVFIDGLNTRLTIDKKEPPVIVPASVDFTYILSKSFYDGVPVSLLEEMIFEYINKIPNNPSSIIALLNSYYKWTNLDKFYYAPIVLLLTKRMVRKL